MAAPREGIFGTASPYIRLAAIAVPSPYVHFLPYPSLKNTVFAGALPPHPQSRRRRLGSRGRATPLVLLPPLSVGSLPPCQGQAAYAVAARTLTGFQLRSSGKYALMPQICDFLYFMWLHMVTG